MTAPGSAPRDRPPGIAGLILTGLIIAVIITGILYLWGFI